MTCANHGSHNSMKAMTTQCSPLPRRWSPPRLHRGIHRSATSCYIPYNVWHWPTMHAVKQWLKWHRDPIHQQIWQKRFQWNKKNNHVTGIFGQVARRLVWYMYRGGCDDLCRIIVHDNTYPSQTRRQCSCNLMIRRWPGVSNCDGSGTDIISFERRRDNMRVTNNNTIQARDNTINPTIEHHVHIHDQSHTSILWCDMYVILVNDHIRLTILD